MEMDLNKIWVKLPIEKIDLYKILQPNLDSWKERS